MHDWLPRRQFDLRVSHAHSRKTLHESTAEVTHTRLIAIGDRLRIARSENKITLTSAGRHVGRTRQAVASWEAGDSEVGVLLLARLAELYGVTADYLIFGLYTAPIFGGENQRAFPGDKASMMAAISNAARSTKKVA